MLISCHFIGVRTNGGAVYAAMTRCHAYVLMKRHADAVFYYSHLYKYAS